MGKKRGRSKKVKPPEKPRELPPLANIIASMGDGNGRFGKYNLTILRKAISEEWYPLTADDRQALVEAVRKGLKKAETIKDIAAIGKLQAIIDSLNIKRTDQLIKIVTCDNSEGSDTQVNVQVNINADERRTRFSNIAQRLGIGDVFTVDAGTGPAAVDDSTASKGVDGQPNPNGPNGATG